MDSRWEKQIVRADRAPVTRGPTSAHGVRVGPLLFVTGQSGRRPGEDGYLADPAEHARQTMENVKAIVEAGGSSMDNVIKRTVIVRDTDVYQQMRAIVESYFPSPVASTTLRGGLMAEDMLLEVEVVAVVSTFEHSGS
jgi:2-iminobutanoate/2-iminopropanoate deaminase